MLKKFDPLLPEWLHRRVLEQVTSTAIDWHFPGNGIDINKSCFMKKTYDAEQNYADWSNCDSVIYALNYWIDANKDWFEFRGLNRCILNFYAPEQDIGWHIDNERSNLYTLIYYVNEADGGTDTLEGPVLHKENAGILIPSNESHRPIPSTVPRRLSIAWIIEGNIYV